ncbi:RHOMBOID-like protein 12, mitochondrial [Sesamum alatum]|uniref:RHOMBOID-like protein 12, mitochondrial n=1 Tax=Sesamum alatum TaxID=300844 RepID=A0AAE1YCD9_9LAMI|nr:RHOMBOID-like protein 12, mitochondrial [Sesamum alatum]
MQRQLCVKLLSKFPRNASSTNTNSIFQPHSSSSFLKSNGNPFYQQSFSQHSTLSRSHLWKFCSSNGVSGSIRNGFFSSPVLARRAFSNVLSKGKSRFPVNGTVGTHAGRNFHSFDSQYRGWRSIFRRLTTDGVVIGLIVTNVAVFMLWRIASPQFMVKNFMISVDNFTSGRLHTLITSAFSHRDSWHLMSNMLGLYFFGSSIGRTFGPEYLLKLYLSGAIVGSIFYLAYHAFIAPLVHGKQMGIVPSKVPGLGASGAVNAIMLLDIFLFPTATLYFNFFIPVPAILLGIFIIGKDVLRILEGDHEVSGSAHLGGATVAALAWAQSRRGRFRRF